MAFKLMGKLSLDGAAFKRGIAKAKASVKSFGAKMKSALKSPAVQMGAAMAVAMIGMQVKKTIDWGTKIRDLGVKFGVSAKFLQQMEYAAKQTGLEIDTLMKGYKKMAIVQSMALDPSKGKTEREAYLAYFQKMGVSARDLATLKPDALFLKVAEGIKGMDMNALGAQESIAGVFGKSGVELVNTFRVGLSGLADDFDRIGVAVDDETIERLGEAGDKMEEMSTRWRSGWASALGFVFNIWDHFSSFIEASIALIAENLIALTELRVPDKMLTWGNVSDRQTQIMNEKKAERAQAKEERDKKLVDEGKAPDRDEVAAAAELKKKRDADRLSAARAAAQESDAKRRAAFTGFGPTSLEKIGGRMGMATSQLNISKQQLALMTKADRERVAIRNATINISQQIKT